MITQRLERNKNRVGELIELMTSGELKENSREWLRYADEYNNLNARIYQDEFRLAVIKVPSELTSEDRDYLREYSKLGNNQ